MTQTGPKLPWGIKTPAQKAPKQTAGPLGLGSPQQKLNPSVYPVDQGGPITPDWENPVHYKNDPNQYTREGLANPDYANPTTRPDLNARVYSFLQQGHSWAGLQLLYGLADSGLSDDEASAQLERMRQVTLKGSRASILKQQLPGAQQGLTSTKTTLESMSEYTPAVIGATSGAVKSKQELLDKANDIINAADDGFKHYWDDPVLQKHPSAGLAIKNYLSGVLGPPPVAGGSLRQMQQQLQTMGFGRDLPVDGTMHSPGWRGAMSEWKNSVYKSQLKGDKPGSISVGHALQALNALTPTSAWDALLGYVKQLPDGARQLVGDFAGSVGGLGAGLIQGTSEGDPLAFITEKKGTSWQRAVHGSVASSVNNWLGGEPQTPEQNVAGFQENFGQHLLEDSINVIMMSSILGAGSRFYEAYGLEKAASELGTEASINLSREAAYKAGGVSTTLGRVLPDSAAFQNIPILGRMSPVLAPLEDGSGWYYKLRAFTHTPYTWMSPVGSAVRLGDVAFQKSIMLGGEAQLFGQAEQTLTGDENAPFAKSVMETQAIDHLNDAIGQRLGVDIFGQHIKPNINDLMFVFGGKGAQALGQASSQELGRVALQAQHGMSSALGETGIQASIERVMNMRWNKIVKQYGGSDKVNALFWPEIYHQAANMVAADRLNRERMELGLAAPPLSAWETVLSTKRYEHEILADPDQATAAVTALLAQSHGNELMMRLKTDMSRNPYKYEPDYLASKMAAEAHVRANILPHTDQFYGIPGHTPPGGELDEAATAAEARLHSGDYGEGATVNTHQMIPSRAGSELGDNVPENSLHIDLWEMDPALRGPEGLAVGRQILEDADVSGTTLFAEIAHSDAMNAGIADHDRLVKFYERFGFKQIDPVTVYGPKYGAQNAEFSTLLRRDPVTNYDSDYVGIIPKGNLTHQDSHEFYAMMKARLDDIENRAAFDPDEYQYALAQNEEQRLQHDPLRDVGAGVGVPNHPSKQEWDLWDEDMNRHLQREFLVKGERMPHTKMDKLQAAQHFAEELPIELHAGDNAILQAHLDELDKMGWKLVYSNDISHSVSAMAGTTNDFSGALTFRRRAMEAIGLSPDAIDDSSPAQLANLGRLEELRKLPEEEMGLHTPESILALVQSKNFLPEKEGIGGRARTFFNAETRSKKWMGAGEAAEMLDTLPIQQMGRRAFVKAIRDPENAAFKNTPYYDAYNKAVDEGHIDFDYNHTMSEAAANHIYTALQRGSNYPPGYMVGAAHIEELFKNMGSANFMGIKHLTRDNGMGWAMANMPRALINFRNKVRFDYSPMFSARRWFKTNVKMMPFGIPPTLNPIKELTEGGANLGKWEEAQNILHAAKPDIFKAEALGWVDTSMRYLRDQDIFGLYNRMGMEAHAAYWLKHQGMSNEEIGATLDKIFTYGPRSAMEKSMNFVFFPFSFEKSLYKIMGAYMLDHPAQRLLVTQGMAAYDTFNKEHMGTPLATEWWNQHVPLMSEAARINAFTAGISLGQPGGINRPLANLWLPQSWAPSAENQSLLEQFIPAVKDFGRIYEESLQTGSIAANAFQNTIDSIKGKNHNIFKPEKTTLSPNADLDEGFKMNLMLNNRLKQNIINGDNFPSTPEYGEWAGLPVTKQALREITSKNHPAFGAEGASTYVIATTAAFDSYKNKQRGTPGADGQFHNPPKFPDGIPKFKILNKFQEAVNSLAYDLRNGPATKDLAAQTDSLRKAAQYMAENDSEFYKLYNSVFARTLGPLEGISK